MSAKLEADAQQLVDPGTLCFWTEGDARRLAAVKAGQKIRVERA